MKQSQWVQNVFFFNSRVTLIQVLRSTLSQSVGVVRRETKIFLCVGSLIFERESGQTPGCRRAGWFWHDDVMLKSLSGVSARKRRISPRDGRKSA